MSCSTGATRLDVVLRPARKVRDSTLERRIALRGTCLGSVTFPAEVKPIQASRRLNTKSLIVAKVIRCE